MTAERTTDPGTSTGEQKARISRDDIESKFRELQGEVDVVSEDVRSYAATVGAVVAAGVVVAVFWLGRTRGRRTRTVVEIRRF